MSGVRAQKSGFAREAQEKMEAKYDADLANQVLCWIQKWVSDPAFSTDGSMDNVFETLGDGFVLQKLVFALNTALNAPAGKAPTKRATMPFKKMEAINMFLDGIQRSPFDIAKIELFQTVDLYERVNLSTVINTLAALARKCKKLGLEGFGPIEADQNKRNFTEEQMKAGANVIGLQMGTNKGASQAGQNFGKSRGINDPNL